MKPKFILSILSVLLLLASFSWAASVKSVHSEWELIAENDGFAAGETQTIGIHINLDSHWHLYWENAGDSGYGVTVEWTLPEGFIAGDLQLPAPEWLEMFQLVSYIYKDEVILLVDITAPDNLEAGKVIELGAYVDFLACDESCIPGDAELTLATKTVERSSPSSSQSVIQKARASLPKVIEGWKTAVVDNGESFALTLVASEGVSLNNASLTYFSADGWAATSGPRVSVGEGRVFTMLLPKSENVPEENTDRFRGVLVSDDKDLFHAYEIDVPFSTNEDVAGLVESVGGQIANTDLASTNNDFNPFEGVTLLSAVFYAAIGGLILNLMPCVFPVISIKILGFVQQAGEDKSKIKKHGLVFALGVLVSFWVLSGLLLGLIAAGEQIGWGFQLQSPLFIAGLTSIIFILGLNLSGLFEMGESLVGVGSDLQAKSGYSGSFFSGVLATVVATPCTAPFMGNALAYALTIPAASAMLIFTSLALGMALPYILLSFFPVLLKYLPRPGAWMETFKKALAFLLYATAAWLAWVFGSQVGVNGMAGLIFGLVIVAMGVWIWGAWGNLVKPKKTRIIAGIVAALVLGVGGYMQWVAAQQLPPEASYASEGTPHDNSKIAWQKWSPEKVEQLVSEGKTVYVDFTANWCLTCQVNKKVAFSDKDVIAYFNDNNIVPLKGDWTRRDAIIKAELQKFGRTGVPTNIIYRPGRVNTLLPEVLTPGVVLNAFDEG